MKLIALALLALFTVALALPVEDKPSGVESKQVAAPAEKDIDTASSFYGYGYPYYGGYGYYPSYGYSYYPSYYGGYYW